MLERTLHHMPVKSEHMVNLSKPAAAMLRFVLFMACGLSWEPTKSEMCIRLWLNRCAFLLLCVVWLLLIRESPESQRHGGMTGSKNRSARDVPASSKCVLMRADMALALFPTSPFSCPLPNTPFASSLFSFPLLPRLCSSMLLLLLFPFSLPSPPLPALPSVSFSSFLCFTFLCFPSYPLSPHLLSVYRQACTSPPAVIYSA